MFKKLTAVLLTLVLILGLIPGTVHAAGVVASGSCGDSASWVLTDDGTLTISGTGEINTYLSEGGPGFAPAWKDYRDQIVHVVIGEGITDIGAGAFYLHENMKSIDLPSTVHYYGHMCFARSGLTSIVIPEGEATFIMDVFSGCTSLEYVSLKNTVIDELYYTFFGCTNLKTVDTAGARITEDCSPYYAFADCASLTSIDFFTRMEGVTKIGYSVFTRCHGLKEVTIPANIRELAYWAVGGDNLKTIIFEGDAPDLAYREGVSDEGPYLWSCFNNISAKCYYPAGNETWTEDAMINYNDGALTWIPYTPGCPFEDVKINSFCYEPVMWAVGSSITKGMDADSFDPSGKCTRGQVVTFLWRAAGMPPASITEHPFTDVREGAYYYNAMLWAVENGITSGMTATTFDPNGECTRAQVVTFLHRAKGKPAATSSAHPFTDVEAGKFYYNAMLWAVENGITSGTSKDTFAPNDPCTRGQVVTFLYRAYK